MQIVVTGGDGFLGRTLRLQLEERGHADVTSITRTTSEADWDVAFATADVVFHLAGVNRPVDPADFVTGNVTLTERVCRALADAGRGAALVLSSSIQATRDNAYGRSKAGAEHAVMQYAAHTGARGCILRLPNIFGKWARPNYNSAVATFCDNLARGRPITIHDPDAPLHLVYVDDVVAQLLALLPPSTATGPVAVDCVHDSTVGAVAETLRAIAEIPQTLTVPRVGAGLTRALHATYLSYLPPSAFAYPLHSHEDARGRFAEVLRTTDSGQFSFFTTRPGITRGGHYHHTKSEKFLVVKGRARFGFRHVVTGERHSLDVDGGTPQVVETVPGWVHDVTNIGEEEMIVLLWANEAFDPQRPDTVAVPVSPALPR